MVHQTLFAAFVGCIFPALPFTTTTSDGCVLENYWANAPAGAPDLRCTGTCSDGALECYLVATEFPGTGITTYACKCDGTGQFPPCVGGAGYNSWENKWVVLCDGICVPGGYELCEDHAVVWTDDFGATCPCE